MSKSDLQLNIYQQHTDFNSDLPSDVYWKENGSESLLTESGSAEPQAFETLSGISPGGDPSREPLPVGDTLIPLILMSVIYGLFMLKKFKSKLKKR